MTVTLIGGPYAGMELANVIGARIVFFGPGPKVTYRRTSEAFATHEG